MYDQIYVYFDHFLSINVASGKAAVHKPIYLL